MYYLMLDTRRDGYGPEQIDSTITVGELIEVLQQYRNDMPVMFRNDNGYTYGGIYESCFEEEWITPEEEDDDEDDDEEDDEDVE